jgi:hypothetical protein
VGQSDAAASPLLKSSVQEKYRSVLAIQADAARLDPALIAARRTGSPPFL